MSDDIEARIIEMVTTARKTQKPTDIAKKLADELGVDKSEVKRAIKKLAREEKLVFTYYGSSFVELPGQEQPPEEDEEASE